MWSRAELEPEASGLRANLLEVSDGLDTLQDEDAGARELVGLRPSDRASEHDLAGQVA